MKIIDLLNKIANGEEVPKKIKYNNEIFTLRDEKDDYANDNNWFTDRYCFLELNAEVEIIEEEMEIPENNFNYIYSCEDEHIMANFENIKTTLKDIIDYLKSKGDK